MNLELGVTYIKAGSFYPEDVPMNVTTSQKMRQWVVISCWLQMKTLLILKCVFNNCLYQIYFDILLNCNKTFFFLFIVGDSYWRFNSNQRFFQFQVSSWFTGFYHISIEDWGISRANCYIHHGLHNKRNDNNAREQSDG